MMDAPQANMQGGPPPGLLEALMGGAGAGDAGPVAQPKQGWLEHLQAALDEIQAAQVGAPDNADSKVIAKMAADLYALLAGHQDQQIQATGGNPKQMRAMSKAYAG